MNNMTGMIVDRTRTMIADWQQEGTWAYWIVDDYDTVPMTPVRVRYTKGVWQNVGCCLQDKIDIPPEEVLEF